MKITWTKEMSVGDKNIDTQHKKLLHELNELKKELNKKAKVSTIERTLHFFENYAYEHLVYEEAYMKKHNYPKIDGHISLHDTFRTYFETFKKKFQQKTNLGQLKPGQLRELVRDAELFLVDWWIRHILNEDHKYATHIRLES